MKRSDICVTFDLWQTLIYDESELDHIRMEMRCEGIRKVLSDLGIDLAPNHLLEAHEKSAQQFQAIWGRNEEISTMDQIRLIIQDASSSTFDLPLDSRAREMLQSAYTDPLFTYPPILNAGAIPTLEGMRDRVRKIGLISNTGRSPGVALRRLLEGLEYSHSLTSRFSLTRLDALSQTSAFSISQCVALAQNQAIQFTSETTRKPTFGEQNRQECAVVLFDFPVPEEFMRQPGSLFALSRADRRVPDSEIKPDAEITSLKDALGFIDSLA